MNKKPKFLVVLLSAIITFATLFATVGKPPIMKHSKIGKCFTQQIEQTTKK